MFVYLVWGFMFLIIWVILFIHRKDLQKQMLFASIVVVCAGFLDGISKPTYWNPPTFFSLTVGIEDVLLGFCLGGVSVVLYEELAKKHLRKIHHPQKMLLRISVPFVALFLSISGYYLGMSIMISLIFGVIIGLILEASLRKDLRPAILYSGFYFGLLYFIIIAVWLLLFPQAVNWWNLRVFNNIIIFNVPLGEVLFGFYFGSFWGTIYEFIFGYRLVGEKS
jgi:hypothetical protein